MPDIRADAERKLARRYAEEVLANRPPLRDQMDAGQIRFVEEFDGPVVAGEVFVGGQK